MHAGEFCAVDTGFNDRAAIERRIKHWLGLARLRTRISTDLAAHAPKRSFEGGVWWSRYVLGLSAGVKANGCIKAGAIAPLCVIKAERAVFRWKASPAPIAEVMFQRACAKVCVKISVPLPLPSWSVDIDFDVGNRGKGAPDVAAVFGEWQFNICYGGRRDGDGAFDAVDQRWRGDFVDGDHQFAACPVHG